MEAGRAEILRWLGSNPTLARTLAAASKLDRLQVDDLPVRFAVLRNITLEPGLAAAIKVSAARSSLTAQVELGDFDAALDEVFDANSFVYESKPDIIVLALHLQTLLPKLVLHFSSLSEPDVERLVRSALDRVTTLLKAIREKSSAIVLVHNFELPATSAMGILEAQLQQSQRTTLRMLNAELSKAVSAVQASFVIDVDFMLSQIGYEAGLDERYWHIGRAPYAFCFVERLGSEYVKYAAALRGKNKKCLVLDCDNTLWGGVIGEEGLNGIALGETNPGSAYLEFQAAILNLHNRGILLAINSKNNHADALEVLERHPNSLLRPEHFVVFKINWQDKVANLREISAELNIGLDSLVFVDDSSFECRHVREELPEVTVVELPADASRYARLLRSLGLFDTLVISDEDRRRSEMYKSNLRRSALKSTSGTIDEYLQSLDMQLTISKATAFSIPRIAQLSQKTNQFNLTTRRYSEGDIGRLVGDPSWRVYFAELEDRFDRAGIIAVALVHDAGGRSTIDTFLMSCRVIGRGVERALLAHVARDSREIGMSELVGEFFPTPKNQLVRDFYASSGFVRGSDSGENSWTLSLDGDLPAVPAWFKTLGSRLEMVKT